MSAANLAQPVKFDFGETFDSLVADEFEGQSAKEKAWSEEEVEKERAGAFADGVEQGRAEALASLEQQIAETMKIFVQKARSFDVDAADAARRIEGDARALALTVGRKFSSELLMQMREQHIEAMLSDALALLPNEPHVVVRVNERMLESFTQRLEAVAAQCGYKGGLIILGEPDIAEADCTIEWADGGICRNTGELDAAIDRLVCKHLNSPGTGPDGLEKPPHDAVAGFEAEGSES